MDWAIVQSDDWSSIELHVIPLNDDGEHILSANCKCHPVGEEENDEETGDGIWVHNSYDGREQFEYDERQLP